MVLLHLKTVTHVTLRASQCILVTLRVSQQIVMREKAAFMDFVHNKMPPKPHLQNSYGQGNI